MTASAKIRGADNVVVNVNDIMIVMTLDDSRVLFEQLARIHGVSDERKAIDEAIGNFSRMCDAASAEAMKLRRGIR